MPRTMLLLHLLYFVLKFTRRFTWDLPLLVNKY
ncbi:hypothetical protein BRADI_5g11265v3 [Brachypodium distachyon]|uniref:Uncharacterized protein n=1 Tax=Brachypodium distachyon TaxID=15368 RepID=A0A0Q3E4S5_BRADI|nr:hypothetical protein BRADI_5g11265v3 [Brachypodium distachyon]